MFLMLLGAAILIATLTQWRRLRVWQKALGTIVGLILLVGNAESPLPESTNAEQPKPQPLHEEKKKEYDLVDIYTACTELAKRQLKAPRTAKFQPVWEAVELMGEDQKGNIIWTGWVDAQNAFGVYLRNRFVCTYTPKTNLISVRFFEP